MSGMVGRGRGQPINWCSKSTGCYSLPTPGPICISQQKMLAIIYKKGRGFGYMAEIVIQPTLTKTKIESAELKSKALLNQGVFAVPSNTSSSINKLPDSTLLKIFSFIDDAKTWAACESVCRRWKILTATAEKLNNSMPLQKVRVKTMKFEVVKTATLECIYEKNKAPNNGGRDTYDYYSMMWRIPVHYARQSYVIDTVRKIFKKFHIVTTLGFIDVEISEQLLGLVVTMQRNMSQLRFLRCIIDANALATLAPIRGLKELAIDHCYGSGDAISTKSILPLIEQNVFKRLEVCGATALTKVDDAILEALLMNWKHHKFDFLKLINCPNITTDAIVKVVNYYVRADRKKLILFLRKTGFDVEAFLEKDKSFFKNTNVPTTRRVCLESSTVLIWVEH